MTTHQGEGALQTNSQSSDFCSFMVKEEIYIVEVFKDQDQVVMASIKYLSGFLSPSQLPTEPSWVYLLVGFV